MANKHRRQPAYPPIKKAIVKRRTVTERNADEKTAIVDPVSTTVWKYSEDEFNKRSIPGPTPSDCYTWLGAWHRQGYGMTFVVRENDHPQKTGMMNAQRLAMAIKLGRPLHNSERVGCSCRNFGCTNLAHLYLTDYQHQHKVIPNGTTWIKKTRTRKYTYDFFRANYDMLSTKKSFEIRDLTDLTLAEARCARVAFKTWLSRGCPETEDQ